MNKKEAISDAKLKRELFPNIGKLYILRDKLRGYFSVSEKYYKDNLFLKSGKDFMRGYRIRKVV
ncbi:hypothetical protein ES703_123546 [subsurface metagenome]